MQKPATLFLVQTMLAVTSYVREKFQTGISQHVPKAIMQLVSQLWSQASILTCLCQSAECRGNTLSFANRENQTHTSDCTEEEFGWRKSLKRETLGSATAWKKA